MSMNLKLDLPITVDDMTDSETGKILIAIKKLVDDLNFVLSNIGESNLNQTLKAKLDAMQNEINALKGAKSDETS